MMRFILTSLLIIGSVCGQQDILNQLPDLSDIDVNNIETAAIENYAKDALSVLKQKCSNTSGGDDVYHELESKTKSLQTFLTDNINVTQVMSELEEAKKTGSMDEVFAKYCAKKPDAMEKLRDITETFKKCLLPEEQKSVDMKLNQTEKMVHFLCEKDGDKIAMFIANGGEDCLQSKFEGLQECMNKSSSIFPSDNWQALSLVEIDEKVCREFPRLQECVVTVLEECKVKTPANIIGAVFRYLSKNMNCAPQNEAVVGPDGRIGAYNYEENNRIKRSDGQIYDASKLKEVFHKKCQKNSANPEAFKYLNETTRDFVGALGVSIFEENKACENLKRDTELKMDLFLFNLKSCLTPKEDFLPNFFRDAVKSVFDYLCEDYSKKLKEFRSAKGLQCLMNSDPKVCQKPLSTYSKDTGEVILIEDKFVDDVANLTKCIKKELILPCSQDEQFREISVELLKIIQKSARGNAASMFANVFLVFGMIFFQMKQYLF